MHLQDEIFFAINPFNFMESIYCKTVSHQLVNLRTFSSCTLRYKCYICGLIWLRRHKLVHLAMDVEQLSVWKLMNFRYSPLVCFFPQLVKNAVTLIAVPSAKKPKDWRTKRIEPTNHIVVNGMGQQRGLIQPIIIWSMAIWKSCQVGR